MTFQTRETAAPADASSSHAHGCKTADDVKSSSPATPLVQVAWPSGLTDTLHAVDHELKLLSHASKYKWIKGAPHPAAQCADRLEHIGNCGCDRHGLVSRGLPANPYDCRL